MDQKLPVVDGPSHPLRDSGRSLAVEAAAGHPIEQLHDAALRSSWDLRVLTAERIQGSHAAMGLKLDHMLLSQVRRAPGLPSAHAGLDTLLGRDETIGFEDFLGRPEDCPELPKTTVHEEMERRFGM